MRLWNVLILAPYHSFTRSDRAPGRRDLKWDPWDLDTLLLLQLIPYCGWLIWLAQISVTHIYCISRRCIPLRFMGGSYLSLLCVVVIHSRLTGFFHTWLLLPRFRLPWDGGVGEVADASETPKIQSGVFSRDDRKGKNKREVEQRHKGIFHISGSSTVHHLTQGKRVWRPVSPTFQKPSPSMKSGVRVCSENKPNSITAGAVTAAERLDKITQ